MFWYLHSKFIRTDEHVSRSCFWEICLQICNARHYLVNRYIKMFYQCHEVGNGSWNLLRVFLSSQSVKAVCEEYEECESEAWHSSPNHPWSVHQHIQSSDFRRIKVTHCTRKSNHLLRGNVRYIFSGERLPEMQVHRRERTDWRWTKTDDGIHFQDAVAFYLKEFETGI